MKVCWPLSWRLRDTHAYCAVLDLQLSYHLSEFRIFLELKFYSEANSVCLFLLTRQSKIGCKSAIQKCCQPSMNLFSCNYHFCCSSLSLFLFFFTHAYNTDNQHVEKQQLSSELIASHDMRCCEDPHIRNMCYLLTCRCASSSTVKCIIVFYICSICTYRCRISFYNSL